MIGNKYIRILSYCEAPQPSAICTIVDGCKLSGIDTSYHFKAHSVPEEYGMKFTRLCLASTKAIYVYGSLNHACRASDRITTMPQPLC